MLVQNIGKISNVTQRQITFKYENTLTKEEAREKGKFHPM
jgi:hypothetical protein